MMRFSCLLLVFLVLGCQTSQKTANTTPTISKKVNLIAQLSDCNQEQAPALFKFDGVGFKALATATPIGKDSFQFEIEREDRPQFYYVGQEQEQKMPVIITQKEDKISIIGSCKNIRQKSIVQNSPINKKYSEVIQQVSKFGAERNNLGRQFVQNLKNQSAMQMVIEKLADLDKRQLNFLDTLKVSHPFLAKVAAITTYQSFQNNKGNYQHETDYFAETYFQFADLKDKDYDEIPYLFESAKNYTTVLSTQRLPTPKLQQYLDSLLQQFTPNSKAYKFALGGMCIGLQAQKNPLFIDYGNLFLEKYGQEKTPMIKNFRIAVARGSSFIPGAQAPDFTQNDTEDNPIQLSSLRGKVVLIDFWASWCGPCRRENPNVVRMYNRFKDQGFEILGVSLDRKKDSWLAAIKKDQLTWLHVSDLKGWKNEVAAMYAVSSVPHTVLLDPKGNIIARNLRGAELEAKIEAALNGNY